MEVEVGGQGKEELAPSFNCSFDLAATKLVAMMRKDVRWVSMLIVCLIGSLCNEGQVVRGSIAFERMI